MDINALKNRIIEIEKAIEQSAANHNGLVGRLMEAKDLYAQQANTYSEAPLAEHVVDAQAINPDNVVA